MIKEEPLITKIIIVAILIIPLIICVVSEFKYKDLGYEEGEFTGYMLEIKCYENKEESTIRAKQSYNVKENDYISESLEKNLEVTDDIRVQVKKNTINSHNRIIVTIKQLNKENATIRVLSSSGYEEILIGYNEHYRFQLGCSIYTIKLKKVY